MEREGGDYFRRRVFIFVNVMSFYEYLCILYNLYYITVLFKFAWDKLNGAYGTAKKIFSVLFCVFLLHILNTYQLSMLSINCKFDVTWVISATQRIFYTCRQWNRKIRSQLIMLLTMKASHFLTVNIFLRRTWGKIWTRKQVPIYRTVKFLILIYELYFCLIISKILGFFMKAVASYNCFLKWIHVWQKN